MFINVATEAITAIMITFLLSFDEFCFISLFEQSDFFVLNIVVVLALFVVVAIVMIVVVGLCVVGANLVIGS